MSDAESLLVGRLLAFERSEARFIVVSIALLVPCFALIGVVAAVSDEGPRSVVRLTIAMAVFATTIPVGIAVTRLAPERSWSRTSASLWRAEVAFVVYADLGVAVVLFTFVNHEAAMYGTALFAVIGNYASHFASGRWVAGHVCFSCGVVVALGVMTWQQGGYDAASVIARGLTSLSVVGAATMVFVFTSGLRRILNRQFDEAARDPLTGLLNRRGFATLVEDLLARRHAISFIVLDVDQFKRVNDRYGHAGGDEVLRLLGDRLRRLADGATFVARTGGEEFALAVQHDQGTATALAELICSAAGNAVDDIPITVSVGVSSIDGHELRPERTDPTQLLIGALCTADAAMYEAKASGGNCVVTRLSC